MEGCQGNELFISSLEIGVSISWLVPGHGGAGAQIPAESTVWLWRPPRRHRTAGQAKWGEKKVVWAPAAPSVGLPAARPVAAAEWLMLVYF